MLISTNWLVCEWWGSQVLGISKVPDTWSRAAIEALAHKLLDAKGQGPQVAEWERELNALVYELYGLTEEEIAIVEGLDHE